MASENHDLSTRRQAYSRAQMTRSMPEHPRYYGIDPRMPDHLRHHDKVIKPVIKQVIKAMHKPVPKPVPKPTPKPVPTTIVMLVPTSVAAPTTITAPSTTYASPEHKLDQALLKLNETRWNPQDGIQRLAAFAPPGQARGVRRSSQACISGIYGPPGCIPHTVEEAMEL